MDRNWGKNMIGWIILAEIAFWVVISAGLVSRYIWKRQRLSIVFLALTPVIDLALLILTAIDLRNGQTASVVHGIAAIYIGVSVAYGKTMITWADEKFHQWILKQPKEKVRLSGKAKGIHELKMWIRHIIAYGIGTVLLYGMIQYIGESGNTEVFWKMIGIWGIVVLIDAAVCLSYILFPKDNKKAE